MNGSRTWSSPSATLRFIGASLLSQICGLSLAIFLRAELLPETFLATLLAHCLQALAAYLVARLLRVPKSWQIFNLLLVPGAFLVIASNVDSLTLLAILLLLFLIYLPTFWTRVPYYPTSIQMYDAILTVLPNDKTFTFIDLGCGFGHMLEYLAKNRPKGKFIGVEIGILPYLVSKARFLLQPKLDTIIKLRSFWNLRFTDYDFVYAFLAPGPMPRLWGKVKDEMKPNSVFLVNSFSVDAPANNVISVNDKRKTKLYCYFL
ncbi:MAG: class I SAM-dependent methyltransferase [Bdellovibrionales bacterium]|nr:class I SAM-dependent methyltransferase [Bdellovibrionales bacterium]